MAVELGLPPLLSLNLVTCMLRLTAPLLTHRRQAMRVGNAFSHALDPSKASLFADFPLTLLQEEQWHSSAARLDPQQPLKLKTVLQNQPWPSHSSTQPAHAVHGTPAVRREPSAAVPSNHSRQGQNQTHFSEHSDTAQHGLAHSDTSAAHQLPATSQAGFDVTNNSASSESLQHQNSARCQPDSAATSSRASAEVQNQQSGKGGKWGSDHETDSDDDSLEAYDLSEADDDGELQQPPLVSSKHRVSCVKHICIMSSLLV